MRAKGGKKNFLFISRDVFRTTYRHANQAKRVGVCVYCIYTLSLSYSQSVCWWRGKRAGWKMLLTVLFRPAAYPSPRPPPPSLLSIFFAFLFPSSQILLHPFHLVYIFWAYISRTCANNNPYILFAMDDLGPFFPLLLMCGL